MKYYQSIIMINNNNNKQNQAQLHITARKYAKLHLNPIRHLGEVMYTIQLHGN